MRFENSSVNRALQGLGRIAKKLRYKATGQTFAYQSFTEGAAVARPSHPQAMMDLVGYVATKRAVGHGSVEVLIGGIKCERK